MATLTIRNLDEETRDRLRVRAASRGHSMEQEARQILRQAVSGADGPALWARSRELFSGDRGVDLGLTDRRADRKAPDFSE